MHCSDSEDAGHVCMYLSWSTKYSSVKAICHMPVEQINSSGLRWFGHVWSLAVCEWLQSPSIDEVSHTIDYDYAHAQCSLRRIGFCDKKKTAKSHAEAISREISVILGRFWLEIGSFGQFLGRLSLTRVKIRQFHRLEWTLHVPIFTVDIISRWARHDTSMQVLESEYSSTWIGNQQNKLHRWLRLYVSSSVSASSIWGACPHTRTTAMWAVAGNIRFCEQVCSYATLGATWLRAHMSGR